MFGIGTEIDNKGRTHVVIRPAIGIKAFQIYDIEQQPIKINSVITNKTTGGITAVQIKPDRRTTSTHDLVALELSPRVNDAGSGSIAALKADIVLKTASAARTVDNIKCVQCNIDFPGSGSAYSITNDIAAFLTFLDKGAGHTFNGKASVLVVQTPNTAGWDYLFDLELNSGVVTVASVGGSQDRKIKIRDNGTDYFIPLHTA